MLIRLQPSTDAGDDAPLVVAPTPACALAAANGTIDPCERDDRLI
jgi:hypothetical protein